MIEPILQVSLKGLGWVDKIKLTLVCKRCNFDKNLPDVK